MTDTGEKIFLKHWFKRTVMRKSLKLWTLYTYFSFPRLRFFLPLVYFSSYNNSVRVERWFTSTHKLEYSTEYLLLQKSFILHEESSQSSQRRLSGDPVDVGTHKVSRGLWRVEGPMWPFWLYRQRSYGLGFCRYRRTHHEYLLHVRPVHPPSMFESMRVEGWSTMNLSRIIRIIR